MIHACMPVHERISCNLNPGNEYTLFCFQHDDVLSLHDNNIAPHISKAEIPQDNACTSLYTPHSETCSEDSNSAC